jgi:cell division protease FtsH
MSFAGLEAIIEAAECHALAAGAVLSNEVFKKAFDAFCLGQTCPLSPQQLRRAACHEAGHTILQWLSGRQPAYVTVLSRGRPLARAADDPRPVGVWTRDELLQEIRINLAGRAAEILQYGPEAGLSTAAADDLAAATQVARDMVCHHGMDAAFGMAARTGLLEPDATDGEPVQSAAHRSVRRILAEQLEEAGRLLAADRMRFEKLVERLAEEERLAGEDLKALLLGRNPATPGQ